MRYKVLVFDGGQFVHFDTVDATNDQHALWKARKLTKRQVKVEATGTVSFPDYPRPEPIEPLTHLQCKRHHKDKRTKWSPSDKARAYAPLTSKVRSKVVDMTKPSLVEVKYCQAIGLDLPSRVYPKSF